VDGNENYFHRMWNVKIGLRTWNWPGVNEEENDKPESSRCSFVVSKGELLRYSSNVLVFRRTCLIRSFAGSHT